MGDVVPFERFRDGHLILVPVRVGGSVPARFVLDTGIGLPLLSRALCGRLGFEPTGGVFTGRRMSGQAIATPLTQVSSLSVGPYRKENVVAGMLDSPGLFPEGSGIEGFLGPQFFEPWPFAINSVSRTLRIERGAPLPERPAIPVEAPLTVERDGPSVSLFVDLRLPSGDAAKVEVDTGSDTLILHTRYMRKLGVDPDWEGIRKRSGTDDTGHPYTRYFASLHGDVSLRDAPRAVQHDPEVMFQEIIYDGLLGDAFLRSFDVTYDLARGRIRFADPSG
ncbi:MAG: aspartyl protease family protein [Thermoplasmata archaeon]